MGVPVLVERFLGVRKMKNSKWYVLSFLVLGSFSFADGIVSLRNRSNSHVSNSHSLSTPQARVTKRPVVDTTRNAYSYPQTYGGSSTGNSFNFGMGLPFGGFDIGFSNFNQNYSMPAYDPYLYGGYGMGGYGMGGYGMGG
ncbi:MAG: hypothetical protein EBQ85_02675, partial [Proteobacteria bacterium]|nr:hypothetical protein [Pseudomonadota bacterium]